MADRPFGLPVAVAHALFGVQAQINSAAHLALWHRLAGDSGGSRREAIHSAVQVERSLVRLWGQRGTLHLFAADDWPLVCAAMSARVIAQIEKRARRSHAEVPSGHDTGTRGLILDLLGRSRHGCVSKRDVSEKGGPRDVDAFYRTAVVLCLEGQVCRVETGDNASPELAARWAVFPDRPWEPPTFEAAMVQVARRFFSTYGPAAETDFRYWLSTSAAESKAAVEALLESNELTEVGAGPSGNSPRLLPRQDLDDLMAEPPSLSRWPVRLLGRFDPLLLAHADKRCWVDDMYYKRIWHHTHVEAALLVHGRIRGLWRAKRAAKGLSIDVQTFGEAALPRYLQRRIDQQAEAIAAFVGLPLHRLAVHARS